MAKTEPTFTSFLKGAKGELLETICDGSTSSFVIFKDGKPDFIDQYECNGRHYLPYPPTDGLLQNKAVLLPTNIGDYKDEKELIDEVRSFIHRYVGINDFFESIATYYVLFSWLYDCFSELPYLRAIGDYGSGKSRFLKTIGSLCYKPMFTAGASSVSTIFRIIDKFRGTLVLDEADMRWSDTKAEIVKILNCGFTDNTPVMRSIEIKNKGYDVQSFHVYCPKIVATRERFQDKALESRFLVEEMDSDNRRPDIPINLSSTSFEDEATEIRNKLLMWRFRNYGIKRIDTSLIDETLEPRLNQIMLPLMSIIGDENTRTELKNLVSG